MKVVLAGRSYLWREGTKQMLLEMGYSFVGECHQFEQLDELVFKENPDCILIEIGLCEIEKLPLCLVQKKTKHKVLLFCDPGMTGIQFKKIPSNIEGAITTSVSKEEILTALKTIASGEKYITSSILTLLQQEKKNDMETIQHQKLFTERETQILQYILKGRSNEQIADILFLSEKTVATHKRNIMKKAQVKKTSDLILFALNKGFGRESSIQIKNA